MARRGGGARAPKQLRTPIWAAHAAAKLADGLIDAHHPHLRGREPQFVFQRKNPKEGGAVVLGTAQIVGARYAAMIDGLEDSDRVVETDGRFFLITIGWAGWNHLTDAQKLALVDHELCHCGVGDKGQLSLVGHDIQEFSSVVRRHGLYLKDVELFAAAIDAARQPALPGTEFKAGELPLDAPAPAVVSGLDGVEAGPAVVVVDGFPVNRAAGEIVYDHPGASELVRGSGALLEATPVKAVVPDFGGPMAPPITDAEMKRLGDELRAKGLGNPRAEMEAEKQAEVDPASAVAAVADSASGGPGCVTMADLDAEHEAELELRSQAEKQAALDRAAEARAAGETFERTRSERRKRRRGDGLQVVAGGVAAA